ncbi:MAG TPA: M10 family metallopeptidase C-terminal domain-containing protein [Ramlibacter sp.]|nr:M10 family metallopeptidase C-terminal domain-containing protein [Ramlibacter sp.]
MATTTNPLAALLAIENGFETARWNFDDAIGSSRLAPAGIGNSAVVTYSFPSAQPAYAAANGDGASFLAFDPLQVAATRQVLASIEAMVRVDFVEVAGIGQVTFGNSAQAGGQSAYAYFPDHRYTFSTTTQALLTATESDAAGDVWFNRNAAWSATDWQAGGSGYATLLHEIGHALGLKHPFEGEDVLDASYDRTNFTVMAYTPAQHSTIVTVSGTPSSYSWLESTVKPRTLMPLDIVALQYLYGANMATGAGNDTYRWGTNEEFFETIWDAGGIDTLDCSNQVFGCAINLDDYTYSSIGLRRTNEELRQGLDLPSWFGEPLAVDVYDGRNNLAIALDTVIENAVGGSGNDLITGNEAANVLTGGAGDDSIVGGGSDADVAVYSGARSAYTITYAGGVATIRHVGGADGVDTVSGVEFLRFADITIATGGGAVRNGTAGADVLVGTAAGDLMQGFAGFDYLYGGAGDDQLYGGDDVDVLLGEGGDDLLLGEGGQDYLFGGDGKDTLYGGAGIDVFIAGAGDDLMIGGDGEVDHFYVEAGNNTVFGEAGVDILVGDSGNDVFHGGAGNDYAYAGAGNDSLYGGEGVDVLLGQGGDDVFDAGTGIDYLFLGAGGDDTVLVGTGSGIQVIQEFEAGGTNDRVRLQGTGWSSLADVVANTYDYVSFSIVQVDADTAIWLVGMRPADFSAADFAFA